MTYRADVIPPVLPLGIAFEIKDAGFDGAATLEIYGAGSV
jgi:hypothetical protein